MPTLYRPHLPALTVLLADLENHARAQSRVFVGTAGSVLERSNADGFRFYAHQFYDGDGKKRERYLAGPVGSSAADSLAQALRLAITDTKAATISLRLLGREGFALVNAKTYATLASLYNHGVFQAGGVLIGSHAYSLLLNQLGAAGAPYATEDIDIARREKLAFPALPEASFLEMLQSTGIPFIEVPQLDARQPSTSFKERGRSRFHVDLLVPSAGEDFQVVAVPELPAHATAVPYLGYLLADSQMSLLMAREGCCMVRVPLPERFALHKLMVSQLRTNRGSQSEKDRFQAAVLLAVLGENHPGAIEEAWRRVPVSILARLRSAVAQIRHLLEPEHVRAWEELNPE
ncbi:MAG: hypothetical protein DVS81_06695 [Candidatus Accumulibacter meliphilus]|uniref:Nucleotidyltransferase-like domain-containing protein n=1 Tax=Candidatus Accumulibacter meliphilus TaxID=2211374 RepID=A0A369XRI5_9PROT|nr:MAG: hypothetical protein DVS81_06695 [Candidatus Accumulibacter meliphilus]